MMEKGLGMVQLALAKAQPVEPDLVPLFYN
jgi:hypothetical protein